jgi:hypothetical protein
MAFVQTLIQIFPIWNATKQEGVVLFANFSTIRASRGRGFRGRPVRLSPIQWHSPKASTLGRNYTDKKFCIDSVKIFTSPVNLGQFTRYEKYPQNPERGEADSGVPSRALKRDENGSSN